MSPLVMVQRVHAPTSKPPPLPQPKMAQKEVDGQAVAKDEEDITSPAAARKRANAFNSDYAASITTPVKPMKTLHIPLQRAVLLSTARRAGHLKGEPLKSAEEATVTPLRGGKKGEEFPSDETILPDTLHERAASTPEGIFLIAFQY